jgi:uncharacterized protein (TIGR02145 family)
MVILFLKLKQLMNGKKPLKRKSLHGAILILILRMVLSMANCNNFAVNDERGLAPKGWKIPISKDWEELANALGGYWKAGKEMKSATGWNGSGNGTNSSGFAGMPGGSCSQSGAFDEMGENGYWWIHGVKGGFSGKALARKLSGSFKAAELNEVYSDGGTNMKGFSVRCVKE